jgi:uncharacterized protein (UPF0332 family)
LKEIESLLERAERSIKSATLLLKEEDYESSVSRCYYAMFYATEAILLTKKLKFSSHKSVITLFGKHFIKNGIFNPEMGKRLSKTFEKRLIGDYSFETRISKDDAKEVLKWAKDFVKEIKRYLEKEDIIKSK